MWLSGCAVRGPQSYRLTDRLLIPPGVANADTARRIIVADVPLQQSRCGERGAIEIQRRGRAARVTVVRSSLADRPNGWLSNWTATLESQGCIAPGDGLKLAARIAESVPLDPSGAFHLLYINDRRSFFLDLGPENRLQVDGPILREGTVADAQTTKVTGAGTKLAVEVKSSSNLLGYETAWYSIERKPQAYGFRIVPLFAESHIQGAVERRPEPRVNYFQFAPAAAFYRIFYRGDQTIVLVSAPTRTDLEHETAALQKDPAACTTFAPGTCALMPNNVGVNATIVILVNGREITVPVGSAVRSALRAAGESRPEALLSRLRVRKSYDGKLAPVEFDPARADILALTLLGGEEISWQ